MTSPLLLLSDSEGSDASSDTGTPVLHPDASP